MALETVVLQQDPFSCNLKDLLGFDLGSFLMEDCEDVEEDDDLMTSLLTDDQNGTSGKQGKEVQVELKKRRRPRRKRNCSKNKEEAENQRMTHIAVERNRRRLMNDYLSVLRSIMPPGYVQRGDQASIVGGAINFVKELEQRLQSLEAQKRIKLRPDLVEGASSFTFPQYLSTSSPTTISAIPNDPNTTTEAITKNQSSVADIKVTMSESHANLKVLLRRQPKQLLKMLVGLENLHFTILHLNVNTLDEMILYSFSLKVGEDCKFKSVDDITIAVNQMVGKINEGSDFN